MRHVSFIILFFLFCISIHAQSPELLFRHFTADEGLPSSQVYQAMQDVDGNMWFTTDRGVVKYNGYEFKTFTNKDGLKDNVVFHLFQDYKKRIWMTSFSGKIFIYENNRISDYKFNYKIQDRLRGRYKFETYVDSADNVFITSNSGFYKIDKNGLLTTRFLFFGSVFTHTNGFPKLVIDERSEIKPLVAAGSIGRMYTSGDFLYLSDSGRDSIRMDSLKTGRIMAIRLKNNVLLFAIANDLFEFKNKTITFIRSFPGAVLNFFEDDDGQLWVSTLKGIYLFTIPGNYTEGYCYLSKIYISGIYKDREQGYWITSVDDGIYYLANKAIQHYLSNEKIKSPIAFTTSKSKIYAGYFSGSLASANTKEINFILSDSSAAFIDCIFYDSTTNNLYIGNERFCYYHDNKTILLKTVNAWRFTLPVVKTKYGMFSGAYSCISRFEGDSTFRDIQLDTRINCIYANKNDELLIGCIDGAYYYDHFNKKVKLVHPQLKDIRVDDIREINGNLCFATQGKGLLVLLADNTIKSIDESQGLCSNLIHKMAVKNNTIYCTSNYGISKIIFSDLKNFKFSIKNITVSEGLVSNEINDIALLHDTLWLASKKGISFFNAEADFTNFAPPLVHVISLQVNSIDTAIKDNYRFAHNYNNISIGFESPLFKSNSKQWYQYKLMVAGDSITGTTTNRSVQFLSLEPGAYSIFVKAINNSGVSSTKAAILHFTILAPWYATWWFRFLMLVLLIAAGFIFYKSRVKKLKNKFSIEKKQASLQLTAMRAQMNPHFIFNVMSSIRNYMQKKDMASAEKYLTSFAKLVRYTLDNSSEQQVSLEEELEAIQSFATLEMQRLEHGFDFEINCDETIEQDEVMLPSLLLQPFLENAIKHGIERLTKRGKISIEIKQSGNIIHIAIEDNGVGRIDAMEWNQANRGRHNSFGSRLTLERIDAFNKAYNRSIKAQIIDLNNIDKNKTGTRVEIEFET